MLRPDPVPPGGNLRVIAPASPFDALRFEAGRAILARRYTLTFGDALFARAGFLAGSDAERLADVQSALTSPGIDAIVGARGGYGVTRILNGLGPRDVRAARRWLVGFSDLTALHALWARAGVCSIHGPMVASLVDASEAVHAAWCALLSGERPPPIGGLIPVVRGRAAGHLLGGNLTVLGALVGTPYFPDLDGAVLLLEDVSERPYRIDRVLTTLLSSGALRGVRGVVLGQFTQCDAGADGVSAHDVLAERLGTLGVPVAAGAPIGHVAENTPVLLGAEVELDVDAGTLIFI